MTKSRRSKRFETNAVGHVYYPIVDEVIDLLFIKNHKIMYEVSLNGVNFGVKVLSLNEIGILETLGFSIKSLRRLTYKSLRDINGVSIRAVIKKKRNHVRITVFTKENSALRQTSNIKAYVDSITKLDGDIDAGTKMEDCL